MICPLYLYAKNDPDAIFLENGSQQFSYQDWHQASSYLQDWLKIKGFNSGSRIGVSKCSPFLLSALLIACSRSGCILAIFSERDPKSTLQIIAQQYKLHILDSEELICLDNDPPWKKDPPQNDHPSLLNDQPSIQKDLPLTMLFTSGSTAKPKAVLHSFSNHWASASASFQNIPYQKDDRWLLSLSLWHIGGLAIIFRTLFGGGTAITRTNEDLFQLIKSKMITHLSLVATQLAELLPYSPFPSLKAVLVGGGPIPPSLISLATQQESPVPVHTTYGMTELSSQCTTSSCNATLDELRSAGKPLGDWDIIISKEGEVCAKGSSLFLGYWDGETIQSPRDSAGYFHTRDTGIIKQGLLFPIGRIDQMFVSGGENIHPEEIEKFLCTFVEQAIVVPVPDLKYGCRPVAFLYGEYELEDIKAQLCKHLSKFKHPDQYFPWPSQIPIIKPSRNALQSLASSLLNLS